MNVRRVVGDCPSDLISWLTLSQSDRSHCLRLWHGVIRIGRVGKNHLAGCGGLLKVWRERDEGFVVVDSDWLTILIVVITNQLG